MKRIRFFSLYLFFATITLCAKDQKILAPVSVGELFDKITILKIKTEQFTNEAQRAHVALELELLKNTVEDAHIVTPDIEEQLVYLIESLLQVNKKLWDIEDAIRIKEANKEFDVEFIELARSVYYTNDERCRIKRAINELTGSQLIEEKQYTEYA